MKSLVVALVVAMPLTAGAGPKVAIVRPVPAGPYVIEYNCSDSNEPFARGGQSALRTIDLAAQTESRTSSIDPGNGRPPSVKAPSKRKLDPAVAAKLTAALDAVLKGGPYAPEYPVPEGTRCHLMIIGAKQVYALQLEKAFAREKDAASALLKLLPKWAFQPIE